MNTFLQSLYSEVRSKKIPEDRDIFGALIGAWDIIWMDHLDVAEIRKVKGEWIFSRVLDGTAVQDTFIVPSRAEAKLHPQPDAEYGTTIRIYNPKTECWDIFYGCMGEAYRLTGEKQGDAIGIDRKHRSCYAVYIFRYYLYVIYMAKRDYGRRRKLEGNCSGRSSQSVVLP